MAVITGPAAHAAAQRVAKISGPKRINFNGTVTRGGFQNPVSQAAPPAPGATVPQVRGSVPQQASGGAAYRQPKAPAAPRQRSVAARSGIPAGAYDVSQPLSGNALKQMVSGLVQADAQAGIQPLRANANTLTSQERAIQQRLAGYDRYTIGQLNANAAAAPAETAGAVTSAQTIGAQAVGGINSTQVAIAAAIQSDPELAGAAAGGGARAMIANEIAAQRVATAATTGANVAYAGQVGGNAGQAANFAAMSGIMGAREGQQNVANTFGSALSANNQKIQAIQAGMPADYAKQFAAARQQQFTNQTVVNALAVKRRTAQTAAQKVSDTAAYNRGRLRIGQLTADNAANRLNTAQYEFGVRTRLKKIDQRLAGKIADDRVRHELVGEKQAAQRILKMGSGGGGDVVSQRAAATRTRKAAGIVPTIRQIYTRALQPGALGNDKNGDPIPPGTPAEIIAQLRSKYGTQYGAGVVQAGVDLAQTGYITPATERLLRAQGITPLPSWLLPARSKGRPVSGKTTTGVTGSA